MDILLFVLNFNGDFHEISLKIYSDSLVLQSTNDNSLAANYLDLKILLEITVQMPWKELELVGEKLVMFILLFTF